MTVQPASMVVFTDVDGALRHCHTRSCAGARDALDLLSAHDVPVVLCSHDSAAALLLLERELGLRQPFICESGAALYIPAGYFADLPGLGASVDGWERIEFSDPRPVVCTALYRVADALQVPVVGFSRLSAEQVAAQDGLTPSEAELAMQREFDEPFVILGECSRQRARLFTAMRSAGFRCFSGPRTHYASAVQDPGHAIRLLISLYRLSSESVLVVGVGDDWTDRVLLQAVDVPVVVRNDTTDQTRLLRTIPGAYLTTAAGPAGWSEAILGAVV